MIIFDTTGLVVIVGTIVRLSLKIGPLQISFVSARLPMTAIKTLGFKLPRCPQIKVCGVTLLSDLQPLSAAHVDTIGLNFVPQSPRYVTPELGQALSLKARQLGLLRVAVLMNPTPIELQALLDKVDIDYVQLHGRESPDLAAVCCAIPIIKATSWSGLPEEDKLVRQWRPLAEAGRLAAWLVDAYAPQVGGGTGKVACWDKLNPRPSELGDLPLILAGGLKPGNVIEAIEMAAPEGVDTASGVESSPGVKSAELTRKFVDNVRRVWKTPTDKQI